MLKATENNVICFVLDFYGILKLTSLVECVGCFLWLQAHYQNQNVRLVLNTSVLINYIHFVITLVLGYLKHNAVV